MQKYFLTILFFSISLLTFAADFMQFEDFESHLNEDYKILRFKYDLTKKPAWQSLGAEQVLVEFSEKRSFSGKRSLHIVSTEPEARCTISLPQFDVKDGRTYKFSLNAFNDDSKAALLSADIRFYLADATQVFRKTFIVNDFSVAKSSWLKFERDFWLPLSGAAKAQVSLICSGEDYSAYIDAVKLEEVPPKKIIKRFAGAESLFSGPSLQIWKDLPHVISSASEIPADLPSSATLKFSAASRERESKQLIFSSKVDLNNVKLEFSELINEKRHVLSSDIFHYSRIGYINLPAETGQWISGEKPDPLIPCTHFNVEAHKNTILWLSLDVPENTPAGTYKGTVKISADEKILTDFPVELRVWNFELPENPHLKTMFYARHNEFRHYVKGTTEEIIDKIFDVLAAHRINGNQGELVPTPAWKIENGRLQIVDWAEFDSYIQRRVDRNKIKVHMVPYLYFFGDTGGFYINERVDRSKVFGNVAYDSAEGRQYLEDYSRQFYEHISKKYPDLLFYAYIWDEPRQDNTGQLKKIIEAIKKGAPDLKIFITAPAIYSQLHPKVDVWCYFDIDESFESKRALAPDSEFWIYNWPASFDARNYLDIRLYPVQAFMGGSQGALIWQILDAPKFNPWTELWKTYGHGQATLLYPATDKENDFFSSQRFALMREGIDDFDYLYILAALLEKKHPGQGNAKVKEMLAEMFPYGNLELANNPFLWSTIREKIALEIEKHNK